jgi:hypothetical protein
MWWHRRSQNFSSSPTNAFQPRTNSSSGHTPTRESSRPATWAAALDHGQSCGVAKRRARTGLRSTCLAAASRCRSAITKEWKRCCQRRPFQHSRKLTISKLSPELPSERKPKARVRSEHHALRQAEQDRGFATKRDARVLDRDQLNGDPNAPDAELDAAVAYSESCRAGLGIDFAEEVYAAIALACIHPQAGLTLSENTRRRLVKRFPFGIIYQTKKRCPVCGRGR